MSCTLIFDIGKTHAKAIVFDAVLQPVARRQRANSVLTTAPYPHLDVDGLWQWMLEAMRDSAAQHRIEHIIVTTHGATAALIDPARGENGLVLPVLDYEHSGPEEFADYEARRPAFAQTFSPALPGGLNLGRQLHWLRTRFPKDFARAQAVLLYPQYWTWRLSGALLSECSSLGCHTDLWSPRARDFSVLVPALGLLGKIPPRRVAWGSVQLHADIADRTGLTTNCAVHAGVHDSNAGYARQLKLALGRPFVLVSTGTWVVCMASHGALEALDETRDMLANVDIHGNPVACARFMGGREFAAICGLLGADPDADVSVEDVQAVVDAGALALPSFGGASGPFAASAGRIVGQPANGAALATLYTALMIDQLLDLLAAPGEIVIEGALLANSVLCRLVAALRNTPVGLCGTGDSSALGAAMLCHWEREPEMAPLQHCEPCTLRGLVDYRARWRMAAADQPRQRSGQSEINA
ncbi:MAG: L-fuculose kinase [Gammaproteobacteria bacterium]|jgi:sugar (pentulose or hexulose) kinase|nr:L-fuculose kinase [Gammaproteobacteria bacterium]MBP6051968.1 hypothetical protein [Pseudomonadales bacterium]MBK6581811.1 L-fuculose kinase [Gammaproteobacteria bacterium]MBK7520646.1 L-fuculose kinase [Gammaproteobacteria bacterium]MBK7728440.1 L-fuculose kinase [Gammaproteobacteria bacterium]